MEKGKKGQWVEVQREILPPGQRAPQVPADTQQAPLIMWVKGFLKEDVCVGDETTIETLTGRLATGKLTQVNPKYDHGFGQSVPELLTIGTELRNILWGEAGNDD